MKYDVTRPITDLDGKQIEDEQKRKLQFKSIFVGALTAPVTNPDRSKKLEMFCLAQKIFKSEKDVELKTDEVVLIKDTVSANYPSPIITGMVEQFFEGQKLEAAPAN